MLARNNDTNTLWMSSKPLLASKTFDAIADTIVAIPTELEMTRLKPLFGTGAKSIVIPAVRGMTDDSISSTTEVPSTPVPDNISPEHIAIAEIRRDDAERVVRYDNIRIRSISEMPFLVVLDNAFSSAPKSEDFVFSTTSLSEASFWPSRDS